MGEYIEKIGSSRKIDGSGIRPATRRRANRQAQSNESDTVHISLEARLRFEVEEGEIEDESSGKNDQGDNTNLDDGSSADQQN